MNLGFSLRLEQTQKLIMTPELRQAIKILQLSSTELTEYVTQIITENPLIEIQETLPNSEGQDKKTLEVNWEDYLQNLQNLRDQVERQGPWEVKQELAYENLLTKGISLHEHLLSQLGVLPLTKRQRCIAEYLIGNIDSAGYLSVTMEQAQQDLQVEMAELEKVLALIQNFDPPGIGARNLVECLTIQLKQRGIKEPDVYTLVEKHLEQIGQGRLNKVAKCMNLSICRVQELADIIKTLNPKPGASFGGDEDIRYIVPDVIVERIDGEFVIQVNDSNIPHLTINKTYSAILNKNNNVDERTKEFVESKLNQALWLLRSIEQRRMTIYQVTEALIELQRAFFEQGVKYLRPLTLKQVAEKVGVHESTVSRATSNKYIQTPHGNFEYKFFFSSGVGTAVGDCASSESIKRLICELIKKEDASKPLSDQKLAEELKSKGISIARRTVTKYREEMGIPNAGQRRRY